MGHLFAIQTEHLAGAQAGAERRKIGVIESHAHILEYVGEALINLVRKHDRGNQIAAAGLRVFGRREHRHQHVARMAAKAAGPVIAVVHLDVARSGAIDECSHVRCGFHARAYDGRPGRIGHCGRDAARHTAGI